MGVAIKLKIDKIVYTFEEVRFYCPYIAAYTPKITIEANIGSILIITSIYVLYKSALNESFSSYYLILSIFYDTNFYHP